MTNVIFSYRSDKPIAKIEARFVHFVDGNQKSIRSRIEKEVSSKYWKEYRKNKSFRDTDKQNLKIELDNELKAIKDFIQEAYNPLIEINQKWLKTTIHNYYNQNENLDAPNTLLGYFDYFLLQKKTKIKPSTFKKWMVVRNKLERFQKDKNTIFKVKDVNHTFLDSWINWSLAENYDPNTINSNFKSIRFVCQKARLNDIEANEHLNDLTADVLGKKTPIIYLSLNELDKIKQLDGLPEYLDNARDWLLISCFTGQRISDFMRFDTDMIRIENGRKFIDITQEKTGSFVSIPLLPIVSEILEKRNGQFPRRISDQKYNTYLKKVCKRAGINEPMEGKLTKSIDGQIRKELGIYPKYELISSHVGRRSLASNFYGKMHTALLKTITGHKREETLLIYIGVNPDTANDAYDAMTKLNTI